MASMICFGIRPLTLLLAGIPVPSTASILKRTKSQFSHGHTSLSHTGGHRHLLIRRIFRSKTFALGNPSEPSRNDENDKKKGQAVVGASFVLACAVGIIIGSGLKMNPKAIAGPRVMHSKTPRAQSYPLSGRDAMLSLLDATAALSKIEPPSSNFQLAPRPSMEEVNHMKIHAARLMQHGKAEDAVDFLQDAYNFYKNDPEPAYHVEMALVELLICQGKYKQALERSCLNDEQRLHSDGRFPLYKAIIYTLLDEKETAKKWWEEYAEAVEGGISNHTGF